MKFVRSKIPDVLLIEPEVFHDARGFFVESFNQRGFERTVGRPICFVQDNQSRSRRGVLRGLHFQSRQAQGKLVRVTRGAVFDVAVDLRRNSASWGQWVGFELTENNGRQVWIPDGFAHGFLALDEVNDLFYKSTDYYLPEYQHVLAWNDPDLGIAWPRGGEPVLSERDRSGMSLRSFLSSELARQI